jgi:ABC-type oligopeptide transport system ATPase subunit
LEHLKVSKLINFNLVKEHDEYELETYFDDHGISKEMQKIFNLHLGEIYSSELKKILSSAVIPNDMGEKHRVFEGSSKFLSKLGSKVCLFKAGGDKGNNSTIITEGELKAIKIHQETGYEAWSGTGGCKTFEEEWIDEFKDKEKIYIVYDNDKFGLDGAEIVARKLRLGRCYIAQIPEEVGKDITDYFMAGKSKKDFENLLKEAICAEELFNRKAELTGEENEKKAESRVEEVVNLAISAGLKVRLDEGGRSLVILPEHPVTAFLAKSREVENWLRGLIYKKKAGTVSDNTLKTVIGTLTGKAVSENQVVKTYLRTAFIDDRLYYNLGDGKRVVVIDVNGWKIWDGVDGESMPYFLVSSLNKQQVIPAKNGDLKEVLKLINVHDRRSKIILLTTLVAWLFPHIPRPVLLLIGPKGSAKSTTLKIIIMLIDPSHAPLIREPKDLRELAILTTHKSVIGLDNLSMHIPEIKKKLNTYTGKLYIKEFLGGVTLFGIENYIDQCILLGIVPDVVIIDYDELIDTPETNLRDDQRLQLLHREAKRKIAVGKNVALWIPIQSSKEGADEDVMRMTHAANSYGKGREADLAMTLSRKEKDKVSNTARISIGKSRLGPDGMSFPCHFDTSKSLIRIYREGTKEGAKQQDKMVSDEEYSKQYLLNRYKQTQDMNSVRTEPENNLF